MPPDQPQLTHVTQGRISAFHDALTAYLAAHLPGVKVDQHFGQFDLEEFKSFGATAPAVRVSLAGPSHTLALSSGDREAHLVCAAFVITKAHRLPAHRQASDLAEFISARVHRQTYGLTFCQPPADIQIENHYSSKLRELAGAGVGLFSVSWVQSVRYGLATAPLPDMVTAEQLAAWGA
jgi:phage gp37-like protein